MDAINAWSPVDYTRPATAPTQAPEAAPSADQTVTNPVRADENLVASQNFQEIGDMGPLPWDAQPTPSMDERKEAIRTFYREAMGREVSEHGLNFWANSDASLETIRSVVQNSPEAKFYQGMKGGDYNSLESYETADPENRRSIEKMLNLVDHPTLESHLAAAKDLITSSLEYKALSPEHQQALDGFFQEATKGASDAQINETAIELLHGLKHERFTSPDAFGQTTLDHMAQFNQSSLSPHLKDEDKGALGRELLGALTHPERLTQGKDTLDCAEATLEATLAYSQPADYARLAVGLLTQGSARIPGAPGQQEASSLNLATTGDAAGRNRLSFFMQRSFAAHVSSSAATEAFGPQDTGLDARQVKLLYDGIIGKDHLTIYANQGVDVSGAIEKALKDQHTHNPVVKVTMRSGEALHSKAVIGTSETGVSLWDPATGKGETMSKEEFNRQLVRATLAGDASGFGRLAEGGDPLLAAQQEGGGRAGTARRFG